MLTDHNIYVCLKAGCLFLFSSVNFLFFRMLHMFILQGQGRRNGFQWGGGGGRLLVS